MPDIMTSAGRIGIATAGEQSTPILFLHGVGSDKSVWHPQLDHFGKSRLAVAIDYPGYGESEFKPGATRDDFARAAWAALNALNIDQAHICGLSLGGVVAIAMYHFAPHRCSSLILADTFAVHPDGRAIYERGVAGSSDLPAMAEARVDTLLGQPADPDVRREVVETMSRIDPAAYRIGAEAVWLADQRERAAEISIPTLIVCGEEDRPTPPDLSRELHEMIQNSRLAMIAGAGHLTNLEKPAEFNALVEGFVTDVERA